MILWDRKYCSQNLLVDSVYVLDASDKNCFVVTRSHKQKFPNWRQPTSWKLDGDV